MNMPTETYRIQFNPAFGFQAAHAVIAMQILVKLACESCGREQSDSRLRRWRHILDEKCGHD
jgi:hypothetical protein